MASGSGWAAAPGKQPCEGGPRPARRTCSMSICTRPTMLTTLLSRRPVCLDWKDESRMLERRPDTRPRKGKACTWGHSTWGERGLWRWHPQGRATATVTRQPMTPPAVPPSLPAGSPVGRGSSGAEGPSVAGQARMGGWDRESQGPEGRGREGARMVPRGCGSGGRGRLGDGAELDGEAAGARGGRPGGRQGTVWSTRSALATVREPGPGVEERPELGWEQRGWGWRTRAGSGGWSIDARPTGVGFSLELPGALKCACLLFPL